MRICVRVLPVVSLAINMYAIFSVCIERWCGIENVRKKVESHLSILLKRWPSSRVMNIACVRIAAGKCYFPIYLIL